MTITAANYDLFYRSDRSREAIPELVLQGWPRNRFEAILHAAPTGESVLDAGCGNGYLLFQLRKRFKRLIGLEYSPHRLEQARLNLTGLPFEPLLGSAEAMTEIGTGTLDCVVSADTIEHIPDVYAASREIFRVLRPGGLLILNTPNIASLPKRLRLLCGRFPSTSQPDEGLGSDVLFDGGHLHYFTFRSLARLLEKAGFSIERRLGYGRFGRIHDLRPSLLSGGVQLVARKQP